MEWAPVSQRIWDMKYRFRDAAGDADAGLDATWWRVARALAAPERDPELWAGRFHEALQGFNNEIRGTLGKLTDANQKVLATALDIMARTGGHTNPSTE